MRAKKRFSQNFLIDMPTAARIVGGLDIQEGDTIFEVGAGRGILTEMIGTTGARLIAFEIDRDLVRYLESMLRTSNNIRMVQGDFLKIKPSDYHDGIFKLVGNVPFDITSPLIDWVVKYHGRIVRAVLTVQEEPADRLAAKPGSKAWAPISIFTQCFFDIEKAMTIPAEAFRPRPRVSAATLVLRPREPYVIDNWSWFERVVRQAFKYRRKLLVNNLAGLPGLDKVAAGRILEGLGFDRLIRAENICIADYIRLANRIESADINETN